MSDPQEVTKKFELPGSKPHYPPSINFIVTHMRLEIEANFEDKTISCKQQLSLTTVSQTDSVELDATELEISSVAWNGQSLPFRTTGDKLVIRLDRKPVEGESFHLELSYFARPRRGFYFITPDKDYQDKRLEAWTQGEATESKFWFPCIDHPQVKFTSEILVTVPHDMLAISNGRLLEKRSIEDREVFHWIESHPHPAYLTSVVIGRFVEVSKGIVQYYVSQEHSQDIERTFERTPKMLFFFEEYFGVKYPFDKYSQVAVQDFIFGGMENSSCTTLTEDTLHDEKAHVDFTSDHLVSHELAHQWFGDLVTCRDWQHIWLNEGFATYCEALYWESSRGPDEFQYYVMQTADDYLEEAESRYMRPIVTKIYKHPDDLFDRHTYEKAGTVLHMLRNEVGDAKFRQAVGTFLQRFADSTAESDDLRRIFEIRTGKSLQRFFDQWIYRAGHPELKVSFTQEASRAKIKIEQLQGGEPFEFSLEIRIALQSCDEIHIISVSEKETEFQIAVDGEVEWFSIDPLFKLLKTISIKAPKEMLTRQLRNGRTVIERIGAARALKSESAEAVVNTLREAVIKDTYWGVSAEAAKTLGDLRTDYAYQSLVQCLGVEHPKVKRAVVKAIGEYRKQESIKILSTILAGDKSYYVEAEAATAIGKTRDINAIHLLRKAAEGTSFQNIVAQGAIAGLKEFTHDRDIAEFLIQKTRYGNHHRVREAATFALGKYVDTNKEVFAQLRGLLNDKWFRVRINACRAFAEGNQTKAINELIWVTEHDLDHRVRRVAEECIIMIRQSTTRPRELAGMHDELDRIRSKNLELMEKMDRLERQTR